MPPTGKKFRNLLGCCSVVSRAQVVAMKYEIILAGQSIILTNPFINNSALQTAAAVARHGWVAWIKERKCWYWLCSIMCDDPESETRLMVIILPWSIKKMSFTMINWSIQTILEITSPHQHSEQGLEIQSRQNHLPSPFLWLQLRHSTLWCKYSYLSQFTTKDKVSTFPPPQIKA